MPWIIFTPDEAQAPMMRLPALDGTAVDLRDFNGKANLALFFPHRLDCLACWEVARRIDEAAGTIRAQGCEALVILPGRPTQPPDLQHTPLLVDETGELARRYHAIFEFDTAGMPMVFVLTQYGIPFRAWVDAEPAPDEIMKRLLKYLDAASLLCPE